MAVSLLVFLRTLNVQRATHNVQQEYCSISAYFKPPKGGTPAAVGAPSPDAQSNPSPLEFRVYAEHRQFTEQCSCSVS